MYIYPSRPPRATGGACEGCQIESVIICKEQRVFKACIYIYIYIFIYIYTLLALPQ